MSGMRNLDLLRALGLAIALATATAEAGAARPAAAATELGAEPPAAVSHREGVETHHALDALYGRFAAAYEALDAAAVAELYARDALYLAPGLDVERGRETIGASFADFFDKVRREGDRLAIRFTILDRVAAPGLVADVGYFDLTRAGTDGTSGWRGKFSLLAREEQDGRWRLHVDSYSGIESESADAAAGEPASADRRAAARAELVAAETAFAEAFARRDRDAFFAAIAPDAVFLGPDRALIGKKEIESVWGGFFTPPEAPFSWQPTRAELNPAADLGLTNGPVRDASGTWVANFQSIWRREPDGRWRVIFDGAPSCTPPGP